ncbi:exported hypothetical protein [Vibrio jasicida]|uniref:Hemolysin D n=1 Tax=Vibrio jasicida TaxID=766224 RepID=A0AAU9QVH2_9VIBR|nr:exported hypothetical protein [Vibrio jasicida]CAH1601478.1 exported hypothetical protein [Vibrio jasicida]
MKNLANLAFAIGLSFGATTFASSAFAIANNNPTLISKQISEMRSTTYVSNANTPIRDIKSQAKRQLVSETLDILPTYITSTQSLVNNEYTEKMQFVAAALIDVSKEQYDIKYEKDMITVTLDARVTFDTNEINRKVQAIQDNEDRNKIVESTLTKQLKLEAQVKEISDLFKVSIPSDVKQGLVVQQVLSNELVNVPLGDMVAEFELQTKIKEAERKLKVATETNQEWLSLEEEQRNEYEANVEIGRLIDEGYLRQIQRPLKLAVKDVSELNVTLTVEPLEGAKKMMPWYFAVHEEFIPLVQKVAGGTRNLKFYNSGCYKSDKNQMAKQAWLSIFEQGISKDKTNGIILPYVDGKVFSPKPGENYALSNHGIKLNPYMFPWSEASIPGTENPIFFNTQNFNGKEALLSLPQNVTWNKTTSELNEEYSSTQTGAYKQSLVNVWGLKITINGTTRTVPWIQRDESRSSVYIDGLKVKDDYAYAYDPNFTLYSSKELKILNNFKNQKHASKFKHIDPLRTGYVACGTITYLSYPTFEISKSDAKNLTNAKIEIFRY